MTQRYRSARSVPRRSLAGRIIAIYCLAGFAAAAGVIGVGAAADWRYQHRRPEVVRDATSRASRSAVRTTASPGPVTGDGLLLVGQEVAPGYYETVVPAGDGCSWAVLGPADSSGQKRRTLMSGTARPGEHVEVVLVPTDGAFETLGCGTWVRVG